MARLWHLGVGSPINGFLRFVRWDDASGAGSGSGDGAGASGGSSGAGQGDGGAGGDAGAGSGAGGQGAGQQQDWRSGLDADIKDHPCLKDFKSEKEVAKAYVGAQRLIGVDKLPIPKDYATNPEVRGKFLNDVADRLGRPKESKDYKITDVKFPDGVDVKKDPDFVNGLKAESHKLGLLPHQVDGLYSWYMTLAGNKIKAHGEGLTKAKQDSEASLRAEYGSAYDGKVTKAQELLNKFGGDDYKSLLDSGFGNNPAVIRFMSKMADSISEDTFTRGGGEATMTPGEADKELTQVRNKLVAMDQSNPEYKELLKRRNDLMSMSSPEK